MKVKYALVLLLVFFLTLSTGAGAGSPRGDIVAGPLAGEVTGVLDGDTVSVRVHVWIGQEVETSVRIAGIDAPEIHGKCEKERRMAENAKEELQSLISGNPILLTNIRLEKYAGRVLAAAQTKNGTDIARHMLDKGLVRPYRGEKRRPWCTG
jgi:endonuclease YncB( thermonuclease family)